MLCILRATGFATLGLASGWLGVSRVDAASAPPERAAVTPVTDADWLSDAERVGGPVADAVVPLPTGTAGSLACIGLIVGLRLSRHRHWVTLR